MSEILLVGTDTESAAGLSQFLRAHGYEVTTAPGFKQAVEVLNDRSPALVITALRLGAYNGLGLIIRVRAIHPRVRGIILAPPQDEGITREATREDAEVIIEPIDRQHLLTRISTLLGQATPRKWPRKQPVHGLLAYIDRRPGRVLDVSYEGFRFEWRSSEALSSRVSVTVPGVPLSFQARPIWTRREPSGALLCGAALCEPSEIALDSWRKLVDVVPPRTSRAS